MTWIDVKEMPLGPSADDLRALGQGGNPTGDWIRQEMKCGRVLFKNLTVTDVQSVRARLYQARKIGDAGPSVDAAVRFCEVNMWHLRKRMKQLWGRESGSLAILTGACLVEAFLVSADPRLLNTTVKLVKSTAFPSARILRSPRGRILGLANAIVHECARAMERLLERRL